MSWDASLECGCCGHDLIDRNYTHNTSRMIYGALQDAGVVLPNPDGHGTVAWWGHLNGMTGPEGAAYLDAILTHLAKDPGRYRAMNPENGWGNYDDLVTVLTEMRDAVPEHPTAWRASG